MFVSPVSSAGASTRLALGGNPWGIVFDTHNGYFYVAGTPSGIAVVNPVTNKVVKNITVGPDPAPSPFPALTDIALDNATNQLFVLDINLPGLWVIDATTNTVTGNIRMSVSQNSVFAPRFLAAGGGKIFMSVDFYTSHVSYVLAYDAKTKAQVGNVTYPANSYPQMLAYDPSNGRLYVAMYGMNVTSVINTSTFSVVTNVPVPNNPYAVAYGGGQVFVTESASNLVAVIDASTNKVTNTITVGLWPTAIIYSSDPYILVFGEKFDKVEVVQVQKAFPLPPDILDFSNGLLEMAIDDVLLGGFFCGTYSPNPTTLAPGGIQCVSNAFSAFTTTMTATTTTTATTSTTRSTTSTTSTVVTPSTTATTTTSTAETTTTSSVATTTTSSAGGPTPGGVGILPELGIAIIVLLLVGYFVYTRVLRPKGAGPSTPPVSPPPTPPPSQPPTIPQTKEKIPPPGGVPPTIPTYHDDKKGKACQVKYSWDWLNWSLAATVGEEANPSGSAISVEHHGLVRKPVGEPIPMSAVSEDWHALIHGCTCKDKLDQKLVRVKAIVGFEWEVSDGGGAFVRITGGPGRRTEVGDQVIYQPPEVEEGKVLDVKVQVKALHADSTKLPTQHGPIVLGINMKVSRKGSEYVYEWWPAETVKISNVVNLLLPKGPCRSLSTWNQVAPIEGFISGAVKDPSVSNLPLERTSGECAPGNYVRFEWKGQDKDALLLKCRPGPLSKCTPAAISVPMFDELRPEWSSKNLTGGPSGGFVKSVSKYSVVAVWHAPTVEGDFEISVTVNDSLTQFVDKSLYVGTKIQVRKPGPH